MISMIRYDLEDFWRLRCREGLIHFNRRFTSMQDARCGMDFLKISSMPGTLGPETVVTCIQCLGYR